MARSPRALSVRTMTPMSPHRVRRAVAPLLVTLGIAALPAWQAAARPWDPDRKVVVAVEAVAAVHPQPRQRHRQQPHSSLQ